MVLCNFCTSPSAVLWSVVWLARTNVHTVRAKSIVILPAFTHFAADPCCNVYIFACILLAKSAWYVKMKARSMSIAM